MIIVIESRLPLQYSVKYQKRTRKTNKKQGFRPVFKISDKSNFNSKENLDAFMR